MASKQHIVGHIGHRDDEGRRCSAWLTFILAAGGEWIFPPEAGKSCKVAIGRAENQPVLDGERRKMSVLHEVSMHAGTSEKPAQNLGMAVGGVRDPGRFATEPCEHLPPGLQHGRRPFEHTRVGSDAQERDEARPGQADGRRAIQPFIKPVARALVLGKRIDARVNEQIGVNQDH